MENKNIKQIIFVIVAIIIMVALVMWVLSPNEKEKSKSSSLGEKIQVTKEVKQDTNKTKYKKPPLPKKENNFDQAVIEKITKGEFNNTEKKINIDEDNISIPNIVNQGMEEQKEIVKKIAKTQKPEDMMSFLKEIKNKIYLNKTYLNFKYEDKEYNIGDKFLGWFEIKNITPIFIRFDDINYSYNLRFLDKE